MPLHIDVAFTPVEVHELARKVTIVIDLVRATSTLTVMMSRRPGRVMVAPTIQKAMKYVAQQRVHPLLCGERGGRRPEGFDHGNSPREYEELNLEGRDIVFTSSNGARAILEVAALSPKVLLGSLLNATAVTASALRSAREGGFDLLLVCAGQEERFALDDAWCAGLLISKLVGQFDPGEEFTLGDGGQAALGIMGYYRDPLRLIQQTRSGKLVQEIGLDDDLPFLLQTDRFEAVPRLAARDRSPTPGEFTVL